MKKRLFFFILLLSFTGVCAVGPETDSALKGLRIVYIGDSITDGNWGKGDGRPSSERNLTDRNHLYGSGFMYLCASYYQGYFPERGYLFFNRGVSGNALTELAARWQTDVAALEPDVLSVMVGSNDVSRHIDAVSRVSGAATKPAFDFVGWEAMYRSLLDAARCSNPELKIVLCTPFAVRSGALATEELFPLREELLAQCCEVIGRIAADYGATLVPFDRLLAELQSNLPDADATYWVWDGIHPTPACHRRMADCWIETVGKAHILD